MAFATLHRPTSPFVLFDRSARASTTPGARSGAVPYDLVKIDEDRYRLTLPVTGFAEAELEIETKDGDLVVRGTPVETDANETVLHRGIVKRPFARRFALGEHVRVDAARLVNGLLAVDLVREVPEALRPRTIAIDKAA